MVRAPTSFAFVAEAQEEESIGRVVDSGATSHFTGERALFSGPLTPCSIHVGGISGGVQAVAVGCGHAVIDDVTFLLSTLYYVPGLGTTLISMSGLVEDGCTVHASKVSGTHTMSLHAPSGHTARISPVNGLYSCTPVSTPIHSALLSVDGVAMGKTHAASLPLGELLHRRLGHQSWASTKFTARIRTALGKRDLGQGHSIASCDACAQTKMHQEFTRTPPTRPARRPLERVHFDFVPSVPVRGDGGFVGFALLVDEYTDRYFAYPIRSKSELPSILESFRNSAERHFRERLGLLLWPTTLDGLRSDGEAVNLSSTMQAWCDLHHINHEISAPYAQWQNGKAERAIQSVWQGAEAMRVAAGGPPSSWVHAVLAFVHTRNLLALGTHPLSPWERWHLTTVPLAQRIKHLRTWGSLCYKFVPKELRRKLDTRSTPSIMLGYSQRAKAYLVRDIATGTISISANVLFNESVFPMRHDNWSAFLRGQSIPISAPAAAPPPDDFVQPSHEAAPIIDGSDLTLQAPPVHQAPADQLASPIVGSPASPTFALPPLEQAPVAPFAPSTPHGPRRSSRVRNIPSRFVDSPIAASNPPGDHPLPPSPAYTLPAITRARLSAERLSSSRLIEVAEEGLSSGHLLGVAQEANARASLTLGLPDAQMWHPTKLALSDTRSSSHCRQEQAPPVLPADLPATSPQQALCATLLSVLPRPPLSHRFGGQPIVPALDPSVYTRRRLSQSAHGPQLAPPEVAKLAASTQALVSAGDRRWPSHAPKPVFSAAWSGSNSPSRLSTASEQAMLANSPPPTPLLRTTPTSVGEAMGDVNREDWVAAMAAELRSMGEFGVWELVPRPPGCSPLGNKWVFKIKVSKEGIVERLKARLTLQGFRMKEGRDFGETWAPTGRLRTLRAIIAEAAGDSSYKTAQWDCTCAFLHAYLDREVYMKQPPGHAVPGKEDYVCKLIKAIYGTKQASHLFGKLVTTTLISFNDEKAGISVRRSQADDCLYIVERGPDRMRILTHCDDFCVSYNSDSLYDHIFGRMQAVFKITDYDRNPISQYCGIGIHCAPDGSYELSQTPYIREVVERLGLSDMPPVASPEKTGSKAKLQPLESSLSPSDAAFMSQVPYRETVGALWYIARATRFDVFHAIQEVARFVSNPGPLHWEAVVRLVRYLSTTAAKPLVYRPASFTDPSLHAHGIDERLVGHSDSDWAGDTQSSKSRTGWLVHLAGCLVAWRSAPQSSTSQSSAEAEYVAACALANELVWWRLLCFEFGHSQQGPSAIRCDSEAAVGLAKHSGKFEATKHVRIKYHVLREYQAEGQTFAVWCPSHHQWADIMTKNVAVKDFQRISELVLGQPFKSAAEAA